MALPIRPGQGLPTNRPADKAPAAEEAAGLPSLPKLPEVLPVVESTPRRQATPAPKAKAPKAAEPAPVKRGPEWEIDPKTGKPYKRIAGYKDGVMKSRAAVANVGKRGATLEQLRMMVEDEPDFNLDDLNGSADTFLAHLRVPPNKEEQKKLLEERAARQRQYDEQASRAAAEEDEESDF